MTPLLAPLLLTIAVSFLIGIGLREYYLGERKFETFGTVRTFVLIGVLGFVLFRLPAPRAAAYVAGQLSLAAILVVHYADKLRQGRGAGIIGILIALLTFAVGPLAILEPPWVVVFVAISVLFLLHSKGPIRRFTDRLETGEVLTACKFLAIAAVALPLIPSDVSTTGGWVARAVALLPVTPHQLWWAVVITTAISYAGYVVQVYLFPASGLLLTGFIGGLYSSTATVLVIARRSANAPARQSAAAVMFAIGMMYVRLMLLVAIFRPALFRESAWPLLLIGGAAFGVGAWLRPHAVAAEAKDGSGHAAAIKHPLELTAALVYAISFALVAAGTRYVLLAFHDRGLHWLSFVVGFTDITPFVVSVLQGELSISHWGIVQAIVIASASNNVLKAVYVWATGSRALARIAVPILLSFAAVSLAYAAWGSYR